MHCDCNWSLVLCTQGHRWHSKQHLSAWLHDWNCAQETSYYTPLAVWLWALPAVTVLCTSDMHKEQQLVQTTAGSNVMCQYSPGTILDHSKSDMFSFFAPHTIISLTPRAAGGKRAPPPVHHTHHTCFCPAPKERKKLSQFQAPNLMLSGCTEIMCLHLSYSFAAGLNISGLLAEKQITLFFLSFGIMLTSLISSSFNSSVRSLNLCFVNCCLLHDTFCHLLCLAGLGSPFV